MPILQAINLPLIRVYPNVSRHKFPVQTSLHPPVRFSGLSATQEKDYQEELSRIQNTEKPIIRKTIIKQLLIMPLTLCFPASLLPSISGLAKLYKIPQKMAESFKVQAKFAVTHDLNDLNLYLPYRKRLVGQGDKVAVAKYDAVLNRVLEQAEFYETTKPAKVSKKLHQLWASPQYKEESKKLTDGKPFKYLWKFFSDRKFRLVARNDAQQLQKKYIKGLSKEKISTALQDLNNLSSQDRATKYLVAGQITDLLYKNPNYLDHVLQNKHDFPLRFIITKDSPTMALGSFHDGMNTIMLNKTFLWFPPGKNTTAQHEFIHASSGHSGLVGDLLPYMSPGQQTKFKEARNWLVEQHETKGSSIWGKLRYWFTGKTQTGIRNYAFFNDYEFLTVTLDAFKTNPKDLCQTDAGKTIYEIYKETFGLDPLKELPPEAFKV